MPLSVRWVGAPVHWDASEKADWRRCAREGRSSVEGVMPPPRDAPPSRDGGACNRDGLKMLETKDRGGPLGPLLAERDRDRVEAFSLFPGTGGAISSGEGEGRVGRICCSHAVSDCFGFVMISLLRLLGGEARTNVVTPNTLVGLRNDW